MGNLSTTRTSLVLLMGLCYCLSGALALTGGWVETDPTWVTPGEWEGEDGIRRVAGYVLDANFKTTWRPGDEEASWRLTFDLQAPMTLSRIHIWYKGSSVDVTVLRSTGRSWAEVDHNWGQQNRVLSPLNGIDLSDNPKTKGVPLNEIDLNGLLSPRAQLWRLEFPRESQAEIIEISEIRFFQACSQVERTVCTDGDCDVHEVICDGIVDCDDGSDENNCDEETCPNGITIRETRVCDGTDDCGDNSDEQHCCERQGKTSCSNGQSPSACDNGALFHSATRCDGKDDCGDNSDEKNCDCYYLRDKGASYRGLASRDSSCQFWTSQYPHAHNHTPEAYPSAGLERNYCRNPDGKDRPWCYTNNPLVRAGARLCQRWDSQSPHSHTHTPQAHPDAGLEENFCRNPDNKERPWCYTTDGTRRWDYCNVMECAGKKYPFSMNSIDDQCPIPNKCALVQTPSEENEDFCQCDNDCGFFGDCCKGFEFEESSTTQPSPAHHHLKWRCVPSFSTVRSLSYWMVADCPDQWTDDVIKDQCLKPVDPFNPSDLVYWMPVIDTEVHWSTSTSLMVAIALGRTGSHVYGSSNETASLLNCTEPALTFTSEEFHVLPNGSVHLLSSNVSCPAGQVEILNTTASVCGECVLQHFFNNTQTDSSRDAVQGWLTLGLVSASAVAVVGFVYYTYKSDQWKKLSEKLKVQMMACMATAEVLFVARGFVPVGRGCTALAVLLHYLLLTAFSAMNALAVDLFLTFRQDAERVKLYKHILYTWLVPVPVVLATVIVEFGSSVRVGYGENCWIGNPTASLVAFGIPVLCALLVNVVLVTYVLLAIRKSFQIGHAAKARSDISKAWVYVRISFMMGFTWILGYIYPYVNSPAVQYIFIVLNASQGLLLTVLMTLTGEVLKKWKSAIQARFGLAEAHQDNRRTTTTIRRSTAAKTELTAGGTGSAREIPMTTLAALEEDRALGEAHQDSAPTANNEQANADEAMVSGTDSATDIPMTTFAQVNDTGDKDEH
ncbi:PREDICTED: uncharacterized protein LOC109478901 [Branchiostoma belcheri]|uniref:Uncharacterized protein LOC109478901 n=1 Tax=Branchiostoma belcheri TaxID=7741 RepID=A0A6P5A3F3_BRABE|nr:PREDICTED: uncharacterized protein LOC109478901 [Branchiostoma belcheri]